VIVMKAKLLWLAAAVVALAGAGTATSIAAGPYPVKVTLRGHKEIEFDPRVVVGEPCFVATADVTEILNGEVHVFASGFDEQGNFLPPLHAEKTVEESLLVVAADPTLPTYKGHSTVHVTNAETSPNAGFTNTITLHGSDGSNLVFHENVHILVKPNTIDLAVDHVHFSC